ncbi:DUF3592 domain-containing protein [Capsulimonas corticalis]|nr:DUF3592 domain-containing protein [Capsulimonas corticalis]
MIKFTPNRDWANSGYVTPAGKRMSWVLVTLGLLLIVFGAWLGIQRRQFLSHAAHTRGTVVVMAESPDDHGTPIYTPIFTYKDAAGHEWRSKSGSGNSPAQYHVGETVDVYYSPQRPAVAELSGFFALWSGSVFACGIGLFFFLGGVFLIRLSRLPVRRSGPGVGM